MSLYRACVGSNLIYTAKYIQEIKFRSYFLFRAWLYPFSKNTCITWHITSKFWIVCVNCTIFYLLTITTDVEMSIDPQLTNICVVHVDWNVCVYMHKHLFNLVTVKTCIIYWRISFHAEYIRLTTMRFLTLRWAIVLTLLQRKTTDSRDLPLLDNTSHDHPEQSCRLWINRPWHIWTLLGSMSWGERSLLVLLILMQ